MIATDGELYGHHQPFRELFLQRLLHSADETDFGFDVVRLGDALAERHDQPFPAVTLAERTSWSCHHGVLRWTGECPCVPDGRWKGPLRVALERLAAGIDVITERIAARLPREPDPWAGRDAYVAVLIGAEDPAAFASSCLGAAASPATRRSWLALMEAQRWRLAMFASDGWYWDDPVRPETRQVLMSAARAAELIDEEEPSGLEDRLLADLALLRSPGHGLDGAAIYRSALDGAARRAAAS